MDCLIAASDMHEEWREFARAVAAYHVRHYPDLRASEHSIRVATHAVLRSMHELPDATLRDVIDHVKKELAGA